MTSSPETSGLNTAVKASIFSAKLSSPTSPEQAGQGRRVEGGVSESCSTVDNQRRNKRWRSIRLRATAHNCREGNLRKRPEQRFMRASNLRKCVCVCFGSGGGNLEATAAEGWEAYP
eukprot:15446726-Alexandrium_andersonii.AAC.1